MRYFTTRDIPFSAWPMSECVIPAGTEAVFISGLGGGYAVKSAALMVKLTGNTHDPKYRHAWLPPDAIETKE